MCIYIYIIIYTYIIIVIYSNHIISHFLHIFVVKKCVGPGQLECAKEAEESRRDGKQFAHIPWDRGSPERRGIFFDTKCTTGEHVNIYGIV